MEEYLGSDHLTTEEVGRFGQFKNFFPYSSKRQISSFQIFQPPPPPPLKSQTVRPLSLLADVFQPGKGARKIPRFSTEHVARRGACVTCLSSDRSAADV